ncbi:MAG: purine-nucleoside phosphorylase [Eubacterium sp.]|nr:purine-nucleoside phosphorylase [Eubacterium sp.]
MMSLFERANTIKEFLCEKIDYVPDVAVVLGSGLGEFSNEIQVDTEIDYKDIEGFPVSTVKGHAGKLIFGSVGGKKMVAMSGRFHLYEGYSTDDVTLPVRVFQLMGIKNYIVTNASGAVNTSYQPGDLMIMNDHIGFFCPSVLTGSNDERFGTRFPSMSEAYSRELIRIAEQAAENININVKKGVYCYCKGPMFETPAEIRAARVLGADAVGMSTVPEVVAAVHGNMRVLGISCITNMAAGILDQPLTHTEVMETGKAVEKKFSSFMKEIISLI